MGRPIKDKFFGNTTLAGQQLQVRAKIGANAEGTGYITKQKGSHSYRVTVGANTGLCKLANTANGALVANTVTITATTAAAGTFRIKKLTNRIAEDFNGVRYKWTITGSASGSGALSTVTLGHA